MKHFVFFLAAFISFSTHAFDGCYRTLEVNASPVEQGREGEQTQIFTLEQNEFYYDLTSRRALSTKVLSIFTGFDGQWSSYSNGLLFQDLGELTETPDLLRHEGEFTVLYRDSSYALVKADFKVLIELKRLEDGRVKGVIKQNSVRLQRDYDLNFTLEAEPCRI